MAVHPPFKNISQYIEQQFPAIYREDGEMLVAFLEAYYEFLEQDTEYHMLNRDMIELRDIDTTFDEFVNRFKKKYLSDFPYVISTDNRFVIKHIMDFYRSKGSEKSIKLLMKLLFNEEVDVYYPKNNVFMPSDSLWVIPTYVEVTRSERTKNFIGRVITGSESGATAFVESLVTKNIYGKRIDVVYLSDVKGEFETGELITDDKTTSGAPKIIGSLSEVDIVNGGTLFSVGDILTLTSTNGKYAKVRVTAVAPATGKVTFTLVDGGYGYTSDAYTSVYISDTILYFDNSNTVFDQYATITQKLETITQANSFSTANVGMVIYGEDAVGSQIANGVIVEADTGSITVQVESGSFAPRYTLTLDSNNEFFTSENIATGATLDVIVDGVISYQVGEQVYQREVANNITVHYAFGTVQNVSNNGVETTVTIQDAFGTFWSNNVTLTGANSGLSSNTTYANVSIASTNAHIAEIVSDTEILVYFDDTTHVPVSGDYLRGAISKNVMMISDVANSFATTVYWGASNTTITSNAVANVYAVGTLIGQNATSIGIYSNTNPYVLSDYSYVVDENGTVSPILTDISGGIGASFTIEANDLDNLETISINTDLVGGLNVAGVPYTSIGLDSSNSGVGYVSSATGSGGTGYSDGLYTLSGGGPNGGDAQFPATANVVTAAGAISSITIIDSGEGYWTEPTLVAGNGDASVTFNMVYGYGFPKAPYADANTGFLADVWTYADLTIGEIISLSKVATGSNYDTDIYVSISNPIVSAYNKRDLLLDLRFETGTFVVGEDMYSNNSSGEVVLNTYQGKEGDLYKVKRLSFTAEFPDPIPQGIPATDYPTKIPHPWTAGFDFKPDGTKMFATNYSFDQLVEYDLTTPWDISSATYNGTALALTSPFTLSVGVRFKPDGTRFYLTEYTNRKVGAWDCSTPWDISTATANQVFSIESDMRPDGIEFKPDGSKMYLCSSWVDSTSKIREYDLSVAWDISTATANQTFSTDLANNSVWALSIKPDGSKMYVLIYDFLSFYTLSPFIREYDFGVAWDISTLTANQDSVVIRDYEDGFPFGIAMKPDGSKLYIGGKNYYMLEFILPTAWDISSMYGPPIVNGATTGATGQLVSITARDDPQMGENAVVLGEVTSIGGVVTSAEVYDSGFGYIEGGVVSMTIDGNPATITGITHVLHEGYGQGFWKTKRSHIDGANKIHDNDYYQSYSYEVASNKSFDRYESILKDVLHVAGTKMFGKVETKTLIEVDESIESSITTL